MNETGIHGECRHGRSHKRGIMTPRKRLLWIWREFAKTIFDFGSFFTFSLLFHTIMFWCDDDEAASSSSFPELTRIHHSHAFPSS
jgi:hypothetical protein